MGELEDFVGCMIKRDLTKMTLKISQPRLINKTNQVFNKDMKSLLAFNTPYQRHKGIVHNQETDEKISCNIQKRYMSGVGSLLYLVKHPCPELSDVVRELSIFMV